MENVTLEDVLKCYNSITPSRTRWVRNRNELKNRWKEMFVLLEKASGRNGVKIGVFDPNWHKMADKGGIVGAVNRDAPINQVERIWTPEELPEIEAPVSQTDVSEEIADVELELTPEGDLVPTVDENGDVLGLTPLEEAIETGNPEVKTELTQEEIDAEELARMEAEEQAEIEAKKAESETAKKATIKK